MHKEVEGFYDLSAWNNSDQKLQVDAATQAQVRQLQLVFWLSPQTVAV